jgi:membrane protein DedA with SNARE-associated domain
MLHNLLVTWFHWVDAWGYLGIFLLMAMESSIIPVPSEVVMPPAAYWAAQGRMSMVGVILAGTAGSYFGSVVSYWVAKSFGLPAVRRFGKYVFIGPAKVDQAHAWVTRFGAGGVFFARLLPVVRHLVSIPAGILTMPFARFSAATIAGAGIWCTVLAVFGQQVIGDQPHLLDSPEDMIRAVKAKLLMILVGIVALTIAYGVMVFFRSRAGGPPASGAKSAA